MTAKKTRDGLVAECRMIPLPCGVHAILIQVLLHHPLAPRDIVMSADFDFAQHVLKFKNVSAEVMVTHTGDSMSVEFSTCIVLGRA
jgi:hypothetical protein